MSDVTAVIQDEIGTISLCRSAKSNAFNDALIEELVAAFYSMLTSDVRVVILRAEKGATVWSAGMDIDSLPTGASDIAGWQTGSTTLGNTIRRFPIPVIAMIEGSVWGFACEIAFSCDLIVAAPDVTFAITPAKLGAPYPIGGMRTFLDRLGPNITKEMLFCAQAIGATRLHAQGIINHVICSEEIEVYVFDMASRISRLAPLSITALKQQISDITNMVSLPSAMQAESDRRAVRILSSDDFREGISAFESNRQAVFQGK